MQLINLIMNVKDYVECSMREKDIEQKVSDYANQRGVLQYKFTSPNQRGVPDRIYLYHGRCMFIEFKQKGKPTSRQQDIQRERIEAVGIPVAVVDSVAQGHKVVFDFIQNILE